MAVTLQAQIDQLKKRLDKEREANEFAYEKFDKRFTLIEDRLNAIEERLGIKRQGEKRGLPQRGDVHMQRSTLAKGPRLSPVVGQTHVRNSHTMTTRNSSNLVEEIVNQYKSLNKLKTAGEALKSAKQDYIQRYSVVGLTCKNFSERVTNPRLLPVFEVTGAPMQGDFWAAPVAEGLYAVVPNPKLMYESRIHMAGGMKEAFESNYLDGAYSSFQVEHPAFFSCAGNVWQIRKMGRLILGR